MSGGLWNLVCDAGNALRFRYQIADAYRYNFPVVIMVIIALGVLGALGLEPLFGQEPTVIALAIVLEFCKITAMSVALSRVLHYFGAPRLPFFGYILATEALTLPSILVIYESSLAFLLMPWQVWTFLAQLIGIQRMTQQPILKIFLAFIVYIILFALMGMVALLVFQSLDWIDLQKAEQQFQGIFKLSK